MLFIGDGNSNIEDIRSEYEEQVSTLQNSNAEKEAEIKRLLEEVENYSTIVTLLQPTQHQVGTIPYFVLYLGRAWGTGVKSLVKNYKIWLVIVLSIMGGVS